MYVVLQNFKISAIVAGGCFLFSINRGENIILYYLMHLPFFFFFFFFYF